ncbi:MAG: hypothetical protein R3A46_01420 [Thermomicrobiales bacterium]
MLFPSLRRRAVILAAVFGMLVPMLFATGSPVSAGGPDGLQRFYFPWVPNGDQINSVGPWYGKVSFQNLDDSTCSVSIYVGRTGSWTRTAQLSLTAGSSRSISANSLGLPSPGAPVRLEALCPLTASLKMLTPDSRQSPWSDGARTVTGYTGLSGIDVDAAETADGDWVWYMPIVQTNSDWNSIIRVTNLNPDAGADVSVNLYSADNVTGQQGVLTTIEATVAPGDSAVIDVLEEIGTEGWVGYAEVVADEPVGAYVLRSKPTANMAITNMAMSGNPEPGVDRYLIAAPLLFTAYNGWNTGINLANISNEWADVTIRYFEVAGGLTRESDVRMAPRSMQYIYTPNNVDEAGFVGSAMIESNQPVAAAIDEVKYSTVEAISYLASSVGQVDAAIPVTFREDPSNGRHDNSGINIQNLNPDASQTVQIRLVTNTGEDVLPQPFNLTLPPGGNNYVYLPNLPDVPPGTVAAARVTSQDQFGFVALSNDVNYAVPGDGSVTFMAAGEAGYYRLLGSTTGP